jgi:hypothetical protein
MKKKRTASKRNKPQAYIAHIEGETEKKREKMLLQITFFEKNMCDRKKEARNA